MREGKAAGNVLTFGHRRRPTGRQLAVFPLGRALLAERTHALAEVLRVEARLAKLDQRAFEVLRERVVGSAQRPDDPLVAAQRYRSIAGDLRGQGAHERLQLFTLHDVVAQPYRGRSIRVDVPAGEEELVRVREADDVEELPDAG